MILEYFHQVPKGRKTLIRVDHERKLMGPVILSNTTDYLELPVSRRGHRLALMRAGEVPEMAGLLKRYGYERVAKL